MKKLIDYMMPSKKMKIYNGVMLINGIVGIITGYYMIVIGA